MSETNEITIEDVIKKQKSNYRSSNAKLIKKAYDYAGESHGEQCRLSR